mmetsp:Transcript_9062/g.6809  ORF Transcript_9062/g.6809 Transcript_9062/m.6809 type:complete len:136 (-) Transcript_9062:591-998(-)
MGPDTSEQAKAFLKSIGIFSIFIVAVNCFSYGIKLAFSLEDADLAICYMKTFEPKQLYRYFTSEFSHGSFGHIFSNMIMILLFGYALEKEYGSLFFAAIHWTLIILSNIMNLRLSWLLENFAPDFFLNMKWAWWC